MQSADMLDFKTRLIPVRPWGGAPTFSCPISSDNSNLEVELNLDLVEHCFDAGREWNYNAPSNRLRAGRLASVIAASNRAAIASKAGVGPFQRN